MHKDENFITTGMIASHPHPFLFAKHAEINYTEINYTLSRSSQPLTKGQA